jgi:hypothetical protein
LQASELNVLVHFINDYVANLWEYNFQWDFLWRKKDQEWMVSSEHYEWLTISGSDKGMGVQKCSPYHPQQQWHQIADAIFLQFRAASLQQLAKRSANKARWTCISVGARRFSGNLSPHGVFFCGTSAAPHPLSQGCCRRSYALQF